MPMLMFLMACSHMGDLQLNNFDLHWDELDATLTISQDDHLVLDLTHLSLGSGQADITFMAGSYLFEPIDEQLTLVDQWEVVRATEDDAFLANALDAYGAVIGTLEISSPMTDQLRIKVEGQSDDNRIRTEFPCTGDDTFLGAGAHAMDVDHQGEAFPLFVSEPGIGKSESDEYPDGWFLEGTRHASSYPDPFLLRPAEPLGIEVNTYSRVEMDLCKTDPTQWSLTTWNRKMDILLYTAPTPLEIVEMRTQDHGGVTVPPDWAFAPWNDAVMGAEKVREVANTLREAGAPSSVIWTEDWKGGAENGFGYHLLTEWDLDETLYPNAENLFYAS